MNLRIYFYKKLEMNGCKFFIRLIAASPLFYPSKNYKKILNGLKENHYWEKIINILDILNSAIIKNNNKSFLLLKEEKILKTF